MRGPVRLGERKKVIGEGGHCDRILAAFWRCQCSARLSTLATLQTDGWTDGWSWPGAIKVARSDSEEEGGGGEGRVAN